IPVILRSYNNNNFKLFFKNNILNISKPISMTAEDVLKQIKNNEKKIYDTYIECINESKYNENNIVNNWNNNETIMYNGDLLKINIVENEINNLNIEIKEDRINITIKSNLSEIDKKLNIDKYIKQLFRNNTIAMLQEKLPRISKEIGIEYNIFGVRDAVTRYGSCMPNKKKLNFNSRLIMLPENIVDAIIIHELCHIIYPNHSKEFYNLVKKYKSDYDECNNWLKENPNCIVF
ncbi:MAG: M48 family metallopeptidase, partial [Clostridia bacterium]